MCVNARNLVPAALAAVVCLASACARGQDGLTPSATPVMAGMARQNGAAPIKIDESFPARRHAHGAVAVGARIFVVGGVSNENAKDFLARVDCLDTTTGQWTAAAELPTPRAFAATVECEGKIYIIGGIDATGKVTGAVESYDPATNTWKACRGMMSPRSRLAAASLGGRIFAIGGMAGTDEKPVDSDAVDEYDPKADTWRVLPPIRQARHGLSAAVAAGRIWAIGGYTLKRREPLTGAVESMVPRWNTWRPEPGLSTPRAWFGLVAVGDMLLCLGNGGGAEGKPEKLDRGAKAWKTLDLRDMPGRRFAAAAVGRMVYVLGGEEVGEKFVRVFDCTSNTWRE